MDAVVLPLLLLPEVPLLLLCTSQEHPAWLLPYQALAPTCCSHPSSLRCPPLQVMTYGLPNDDPEWVRAQQRMGVQGVIVDDVAGVAAALSATA